MVTSDPSGRVSWRACPSAELTSADREAVWLLCRAAFDGRGAFTREDEEHAYGGVHVLGLLAGEVVAHGAVLAREIMVGERAFQAGYVEAVAVLPPQQRSGLGTALMARLAAELRARHELGVLSTGRARDFYRRLGWESWRGPSYVLTGTGRRRTAEEDDGLMVLRFGPSATVDLTAAIACHDRSGDAW